MLAAQHLRYTFPATPETGITAEHYLRSMANTHIPIPENPPKLTLKRKTRLGVVFRVENSPICRKICIYEVQKGLKISLKLLFNPATTDEYDEDIRALMSLASLEMLRLRHMPVDPLEPWKAWPAEYFVELDAATPIEALQAYVNRYVEENPELVSHVDMDNLKALWVSNSAGIKHIEVGSTFVHATLEENPVCHKATLYFDQDSFSFCFDGPGVENPDYHSVLQTIALEIIELYIGQIYYEHGMEPILC